MVYVLFKNKLIFIIAIVIIFFTTNFTFTTYESINSISNTLQKRQGPRPGPGGGGGDGGKAPGGDGGKAPGGDGGKAP
ncbi:hypothetical protein RhiirA5_419406, partial [Rhizophagus irregularis]